MKIVQRGRVEQFLFGILFFFNLACTSCDLLILALIFSALLNILSK